jgi:predicted helicase
MEKTKVNTHLEGVLDLVDHMVKVADQGMVNDTDDNGFYLLYGIIHDNAYIIRKAAEKEYKARSLEIPARHITHPRNT